MTKRRCRVFDDPDDRRRRGLFDWQPPEGVEIEQVFTVAHRDSVTGQNVVAVSFVARCCVGWHLSGGIRGRGPSRRWGICTPRHARGPHVATRRQRTPRRGRCPICGLVGRLVASSDSSCGVVPTPVRSLAWHDPKESPP